MNTRRTIVVGGGVIGRSLAWELAGRGQSVTVIQREVGKGTSWAAGGILPPANLGTATDPIDRLRGLSHQLYPAWAQRLLDTTGIDCGYRQCGAWYLADTPGERAAMIGMTDYWDQLQIVCQDVAVDHLVSREPVLQTWAQRTENLAAWWVPDECQVRCPDLLKALRAACLGSGVALIEGQTVCDLVHRSDTVVVKTTCVDGQTTGQLDADIVVLTAGAWSGQVAASLSLQQSLVPVRGQMLLLKSDQPLFRPIINVGHRYLICRDDGHVLVGSCEEEVGFEFGTTEHVIDSLRSFAFDVCPALKGATEVRTWSGLRPMTFDGFPMIGRVPNTTNVYVASGHFRSGIHLAPATAVCLADVITGATPAVNLDAFGVGKQQMSGGADREDLMWTT